MTEGRVNPPDFDTLSTTLMVDKNTLVQKYTKRVHGWKSFFDKWTNFKDEDDRKEYNIEQDGDWKIRDQIGRSEDMIEDDHSCSESDGSDIEEDVFEQEEEWEPTNSRTDVETNEHCDSSSNENVNTIRTHQRKLPTQHCDKLMHEHLADDEEDSNSPCEEDYCVEVLEYTKTEDQVGNSLTESQFLAIKEKVWDIQNSVEFVVDVDCVDDTLCASCAQRTFLPREFFNFTANPMCDQCLVAESGHSTCEIENCPTCIQLAAEMTERAEISELFVKGHLIYSPGEDDQEVTMDAQYDD